MWSKSGRIIQTPEIFVVACRHRKPVITPFLQGMPFRVYMTPDYQLPPDFKLPRGHKNSINMRNHMRCCYGHRDVMRMMGDEALIMEDDAVPSCGNWKEICEGARRLLDEFAIVSLHTRMKTAKWTKRPFMDRTIWVRNPDGYGYGSLAYWIRRETAKHWINRKFDGMPMDIGFYHIAALANPTKTRQFCCVEPSPFRHVGRTLLYRDWDKTII